MRKLLALVNLVLVVTGFLLVRNGEAAQLPLRSGVGIMMALLGLWLFARMLRRG